MRQWLESLAGPQYVDAIIWTAAALVGLLVLLIIVKLIRRMTFGTYVAGGRNRKTRLAVMDATAIDSHRRLVLVRRDDVEHLILIGGAADVVVERDIRLSGQRRPAQPAEAQPAPRTRPPEALEPGPPPRPRAPEPAPQRLPQPGPARAAAPPAQPVRPVAPRPAPAPVRAPAPRAADDIDEALMKELEVTLESDQARKPAKPVSLDDEMTRLLGELSSHKK